MRRARPTRAHRLEEFDPAELRRWVERWDVLRVRVSDHLTAVGFVPSGLDEDFWEALREALLAAGATTEEIDRVAGAFVCLVSDHIEADDHDEREIHLERIARHLACTDMTVGLRKGQVTWVHFPNRPQVH